MCKTRFRSRRSEADEKRANLPESPKKQRQFLSESALHNVQNSPAEGATPSNDEKQAILPESAAPFEPLRKFRQSSLENRANPSRKSRKSKAASAAPRSHGLGARHRNLAQGWASAAALAQAPKARCPPGGVILRRPRDHRRRVPIRAARILGRERAAAPARMRFAAAHLFTWPGRGAPLG